MEAVKKRGRPKASLNADDVCKIIDSCNAAGINELKWADLHIVLGNKEVPLQEVEIPKVAGASRRDTDLSELMIMDPVAFEEQEALLEGQDGRLPGL